MGRKVNCVYTCKGHFYYLPSNNLNNLIFKVVSVVNVVSR
jgi:hypothetical protein